MLCVNLYRADFLFVVSNMEVLMLIPPCVCFVQIDIVIVSCSCFAPTPSMAAMITNHFKLRRDVLTYNLSGMGCSSSLICVDLVKHLLKVRCQAIIFFA